MGFINNPGISSVTIGGSTQYGGSIEFKVPGATIDPASGEIIIPTGSAYVQSFTLDATNISNKYVVVDNVPTTPTSARMEVRGFPPQFYTTDFIFTTDDSGKRVSWGGLSLDGLLQIGDQITIIYS